MVDDKVVLGVAAIAAVTILEALEIVYRGPDGAILAGVVATVAALGGLAAGARLGGG